MSMFSCFNPYHNGNQLSLCITSSGRKGESCFNPCSNGNSIVSQFFFCTRFIFFNPYHNGTGLIDYLGQNYINPYSNGNYF
jgi:hypothetical protein